MDNIEKWEKITNKIVKEWIAEYFEVEKKSITFDWVHLGHIFQFADYYIDFLDILKCRALQVEPSKWFEYYDFCLETESQISLVDFILSPKKVKEKEEEYLQELKERVIFAEETFKKALKEFEL